MDNFFNREITTISLTLAFMCVSGLHRERDRERGGDMRMLFIGMTLHLDEDRLHVLFTSRPEHDS